MPKRGDLSALGGATVSSCPFWGPLPLLFSLTAVPSSQMLTGMSLLLFTSQLGCLLPGDFLPHRKQRPLHPFLAQGLCCAAFTALSPDSHPRRVFVDLLTGYLQVPRGQELSFAEPNIQHSVCRLTSQCTPGERGRPAIISQFQKAAKPGAGVGAGEGRSPVWLSPLTLLFPEKVGR